MGGAQGAWPIVRAVAALARLGGRAIEVSGGPSSGVVSIRAADGAGIAANLGPGPARVGDADLAPFGVLVDRAFHSVVAIRNVSWSGKSVFLPSGCGVIAESSFENEWRELSLKRRAVKDLLGLL